MPHHNLHHLIAKLEPDCKRLLEAAVSNALSRTHYQVDLPHWLLAILQQPDASLQELFALDTVNKKQLIQDLEQVLQTYKHGNNQAPVFSEWLITCIEQAWLIASIEQETTPVFPLHLLLALQQDEQLKRLAISWSAQFKSIFAYDLAKLISSLPASNESSKGAPVMAKASNSALAQYTINLTALAKQGKIDDVLGRENEIRQLMDILGRRRQNNPIIVGEPGVGKTALVEGLALRIARRHVPSLLIDAAVHVLDLGLLQAGAGVKGEFERRLTGLIDEIKSSKHKILLFIDEAHTLIGAGNQPGQGDAANLLKPALARGDLHLIAATTWAEYKKYFEQDAALVRRFQPVKVAEASDTQTLLILRNLIPKFESYHNVHITESAIVASVQLSRKYLPERQLPDKAISVLDTACARLALNQSTIPIQMEQKNVRLVQLKQEVEFIKREPVIDKTQNQRLKNLNLEQKAIEQELKNLETQWKNEQSHISMMQATRKRLAQTSSSPDKSVLENKAFSKQAQLLKKIQGEQPLVRECIDDEAIAEVIASWTGIPVGKMLTDAIANTLNLEEALKKRVLGQDHALKIIAQHIQIAKAKLNSPDKPLGAFLLTGPSGVGKTETALALAEQLYASEKHLTVINLSEFKEEHKVSLLLGSPPGYVGYGEGGILTEAIRRNPYSLILLDEVEKAHPGVHDIFYQVFDKGSLRDGQGRDIDCKNTLFILTSNIGTQLLSTLPQATDLAAVHSALHEQLLTYFRPAFLGRLTVIPYFPLNEEYLKQVATLQLKQIAQRFFSAYGNEFIYSNRVIDSLASQCKSTDNGARGIQQLLNKTLLPDLSDHCLKQLALYQKVKSTTLDCSENNNWIIT